MIARHQFDQLGTPIPDAPEATEQKLTRCARLASVCVEKLRDQFLTLSAREMYLNHA